ncbi:MAG TPA: putative lipid II flippase FtsW [Gaiellaceae bacterium]|nr:putative lipid II flippase FtsW [Gaiellaceae bacterium]
MRRPGRSQLEFHLLVLVTLGLVAFGLVMVYSASSARGLIASDDPAYYLKRQALYALVGLAVLVILSRTDFRKLRHAGGPMLAVAFFLLVAVLVVGTTVNGARRWIPLGAFSFQPSELAKLGLALWLAARLARKPAPRSLGELAKPVGLVVCLACALIVIEPDLGTAIAIGIMVAAMLLVSGTPLRVLAASGGLGLSILMLAIWFEPYRRARLFSFIDPWSDPQNAGFQTVQAMIALGSGGLFGVGLGESVQKIYYLPEASTDMIFAIIGEELGLVGAMGVMGAFALLGYAGFNVALRCRDPFGKRLAAGLTALLCGQAAVNLCAVMGIAPLTGIPLPFVSYGGSSLIVALAAIGILLNIAQNHAAEAVAQVPDRRRRNSRARPAGDRRRGSAGRARRHRDVRRRAAR